ncbi:MAG TPA: sodium:proton antiporter [Povalibacter sp.]|nr:sodium:proton antiporter [Povalibacter sp.]
MLDIAALCLVATALFAYANHRLVGLPTTIGVMAIALVLSLAMVGLDHFGFHSLRDYEASVLASIDFSDVLMEGMLSFLLFAGALHVDLSELRSWRWQIGILALLGTTLSAALVGFALWYVLPWFDIRLPLAWCVVFGALISPTDPVAVLGILKSAGAPKSVEVVIAGESLFNDGVGVVLFALALAMLRNPEAANVAEGGRLLLHEAGGGIAFGLALGFVTYWLLRSIDSYQEEVLITLAAVMGGYAMASHLHVSGPLAMVVVGLVVGNHGRAYAMSDTTRRHVDMFWELLDAILNSILFVLIGLEIILLKFSSALILPALAVTLIVLLARLVTVAIPAGAFRRSFGLPAGAWRILTWGGLRGGISVALALSIPVGPERDVVVSFTYVVVVASILVQGLTMGRVVRKACGVPASTASSH